MTARTIPLYACICGARDEGDQPAKCWNCGGTMKQFGTRTPLDRTSAATCGSMEGEGHEA